MITSNLSMALRDSDSATRAYVVVNPLLAKHMPTKPSEALRYFSQLGEQVTAICKDGRVLVIGFAETATAVGAAVAAALNNAIYVHTTREDLPQALLVTEFLEEHSHARNQAVFLRDAFRDLNQYDRLVFVEDEVTTGKTILNFLRGMNYRGKIVVSALAFNGLDERVFAEYQADFCCLQKIGYVERLSAGMLPNPRCGVSALDYQQECLTTAEAVMGQIRPDDIQGKDVLVLGTEECMYPALILGERLEGVAKSVKTHATTRSPLAVQEGEQYPLRTRVTIQSVYDSARTTYLYNLEPYNTVIILTDAPEPNAGQLIDRIKSRICGNLYFVRVENAN